MKSQYLHKIFIGTLAEYFSCIGLRLLDTIQDKFKICEFTRLICLLQAVLNFFHFTSVPLNHKKFATGFKT